MSTYIVNRDGGNVKVKHVKRANVDPTQISYCFPKGNKKYKDNNVPTFYGSLSFIVLCRESMESLSYSSCGTN